MTEGVDVPANGGCVVKLALEELVTDLHVVDHVIVMGAGLVVHRPASVHELEAVILDELFDIVLSLLCLTRIPHGEELHFNLSEHLGLVEDELVYDSVQDVPDVGNSVLLIEATVVLIDGLQPTDIVVGVWH